MSALLTFTDVASGYGKKRMLEAFSGEFPKAAVTGLLGPNGAGKTTLLRTALGFLKPSTGYVRVLDRPMGEWSREGLARTIAYLPQAADAHWPISAARLVGLGRLPHRAAFGAETESDRIAIDDALRRCDALEFSARRIDELSSGERARVLLARALATNAPILLADEPAAHLDPAHQLRLMELLREEAGRGTAVVVTLHDLSLASRFCDGLIVLKRGRMVAQGSASVALSPSVLADAFGIEAWTQATATTEAPPVVPWRRI